MAEEEAKKKDKKVDKDEKSGGGKKDLVVYALMVLGVAVVSGGAGAGFAIFTAPESPTEEAEDSQPAPEVTSYEYIDLESLTVNLNVPRMNRYLKTTVSLAVAEGKKEEIAPLVENRSAQLYDWLRAYLAEQSLDQVSGRKNLIRIRREICDAFNQELWPDQAPQIHEILFKEFAVQ